MKIAFWFWKSASSRRKRIYSVIFVFIIAVLATALGTLVPVSPQEATKISNNLNQTVLTLEETGGLTQFILGNNFLITLLMFIPILGPVLGLYVLFNTGTVLGSIAISQNLPVSLAFLALIITPVFWLEFAAYSIAMGESVWLFRRLIQGRGRHEVRCNLGLFVLITAVLLVVGAILEVVLLSIV